MTFIENQNQNKRSGIHKLIQVLRRANKQRRQKSEANWCMEVHSTISAEC